MQPVLVDNTALSYRCGRNLDDAGLIFCRGIVVFQPGELMARCPECCLWIPVTAGHLTLMTVQTGAATGARDKWTITHGVGYGLRGFALSCGVPGCHYVRALDAYRVHVSAVNAMMDEHPCPEPKPVIEEALCEPG